MAHTEDTMQQTLKNIRPGDQIPEGTVLRSFVRLLVQVQTPDGRTKWVNRAGTQGMATATATPDSDADMSVFDQPVEIDR